MHDLHSPTFLELSLSLTLPLSPSLSIPSSTNMSGKPSSTRQPKRINTGLSEVSASQPKSSGSGGGGGRLSLHIPNSYPRALSPRTPTSRDGTPEASRAASPSVQDRPSRESVYSALKGAQETPAGSGSRTPRTRVFRRDSSLITVHHDDGAGAASPEVHLSTTTPGRLLSPFKNLLDFFSVHETSSSSARDFLARERNFFSWLKLSCLLAILSASLILQLQLPDTARTTSSPHRTAPVSWDHLPLQSKAFAGVFFVLSLLSLATGLADYLSAERQLEKEQVDFDETEGVFLNDAHTSAFVHTVMLVVGAGITASAVWLLAYQDE